MWPLRHAASNSDRLCRLRDGDLGGVVFCARQSGDSQIALQRNEFRLARGAGQTEPAGKQPLVHDAVDGEVGVPRFQRNHRIEFPRIGHGATKHLCIGETVMTIGEGHRAGLAKQANLGHLLALQPTGQRCCGMHVDDRLVAGGLLYEFDQGDVIKNRIGIRHHDEAGDAAGSRRTAG